nr:CU044_5270 family protein [Streptomyces jeddahensis]
MNAIPPSRDRDLPPGRHRVLREQLMREIRSEPAGARKAWRRPAVVAPAVAAALTAAVVVGVTVTRDAAVPPRPGTAMTQTPSTQSAARLLERIASAAGKQLSTDIRDDQFVYTKRDDYHWKMDPAKPLPDGCLTTSEGYAYGVRETWESVDGQHIGLSREHRDSGRVVERPIAKQLPGKKTPNYYRQAEQLPTDPEAMYRWLYGLQSGEQPSGKRSADQGAFTKAGGLLSAQLLPPKVEAALYHAVARIPGLTVYENARDAAGRTGIAVAMEGTWPGDRGHGPTRHELLFDEKTLQFTGLSTVRLAGPQRECDVLQAGDLLSSVAVLDREVVNKAGQRP